MAQVSDSELLVFVRKGGGFEVGRARKGGKGWRKGGGKGFKGEPPPRGRSDLRCIICGGSGHTYRDCCKPELPRDQRPCLNCGKPGHIPRDYRQPKTAAVVDGGAERQQQTGSRHFNLDGDAEARVCFSKASVPCGHAPPVVDPGGFQGVTGGSRPVCPSGTCA